jgi:rubrerythrin
MSKKRKPLLSDEDLRIIDEARFRVGANFLGREEMRDFYEAKITIGALRVVEEVEHVIYSGKCSGCGYGKLMKKRHKFCPGCGNKIKR